MKWILATIFVIVTHDGKTSARSYDGLDDKTIQNLIVAEGKTGEIVTAREYQEFVNSQVRNPTPNPEKVQAKIDLNDRTNTTTERVEAIIKYLDLDK